MRRLILPIFISAFMLTSARTVHTVSADYTLYAPESMSVEEAKHIALEQARLAAIAKEFGTNVSQSNSTVITNHNGETDTRFFSFGGSDLKGEWIETIGQPEYQISHENNNLIVSVKVRGRIREYEGAVVDLSVLTLRNGTDKRFASTDFKDGDEFFLNFSTPANGYLSVWLITDNGSSACRLLPYRRSGLEAYPVIANKEYTFFSTSRCASSEETALVDEFEISTSQDLEFNELIVIFSPHPFAPSIKGKDTEGVLYSSAESFREWLVRFQRNDRQAVVSNFLLKISK